MDLLKNDAKRFWEKYGKFEIYSNYAQAWYTGEGIPLCMECAVGELEEYIKHHADEGYCWYSGELPEHLDNIQEGPPVHCEHCNGLIFEGYEECVKCGNWNDSDQMTYDDEKGGMVCKNC